MPLSMIAGVEIFSPLGDRVFKVLDAVQKSFLVSCS